MNNFISDIGGTHERCFVLKNMLKYVSFWPDAIQSSVASTILALFWILKEMPHIGWSHVSTAQKTSC